MTITFILAVMFGLAAATLAFMYWMTERQIGDLIVRLNGAHGDILEYRNVNTMFKAEINSLAGTMRHLAAAKRGLILERDQADQALMYAEEERQIQRDQTFRLVLEVNDLKVAKMDDDRMFQMLTGRLEAATTKLRVLAEQGVNIEIDEAGEVNVSIKAPEGYEIVKVVQMTENTTSIFKTADDVLSAQGMPDFMRSDYDGPEPDDLMGPTGAPTPDQRIIELLEQIAFNTTEPAYEVTGGYQAMETAFDEAMQADEDPELYPAPEGIDVSEERLAQLRADGLIH